MPFTREEFTRLVNLVVPVLPDLEKRRSILSLAFFDAPFKQGVVPLDLPANTFTTNLLSYWHTRSEPDLLTLLQVIQENEGGDIARDLAPFVERLRTATALAEPTYKLFISYRRKSWDFTHRLAADLKGKINADIFVDYGGVDSSDFERSIMTHLRAADCVLVVVTEHTFSERIHQPGDWMRKEIAEALRLGKPTVLIAHEGRFPPPPEELPIDIRAVAGRQGIRFFPDFWDAAVAQLVAFIPKAIQHPPEPYVGDEPRQSSPSSLLKEKVEEASPPLATSADYAALYEQAMHLYEAEDYEQALPLLRQLQATNFRIRVIAPLIRECETLLQTQGQKQQQEAQQREAEARYGEVAELAQRARTESARAEARAELEQFAKDFPAYGDPEDVATKLVPPKPRTVDLLPAPFAWIPIPAGKVTLKTESGWAKNYIPEGKSQAFDVVAFRIAKYPLTNAQFALFIEAGGYTQDRWWAPDGIEARRQGIEWNWTGSEWKKQVTGKPWVAPRYWQDAKWNQSDRPVVGVSWYEAVAYCAWLSEQTGEVIHLPTEQEWQRAAQGDDGRDYPWGSPWDGARCNNNVDGKGIGKTTPVTQYEGKNKGDSPFGVVDMAGNVWEWCLTAYESGKIDLKGTDVRVLRGGSWYSYYADYFRCGYRIRLDPDFRSFFRGFRLALS